MVGFTTAIGLIGAIVIVCLIIVAYQPVMGSVAEDANRTNMSTSIHNGTYQQGVGVAQGFMGLDMAFVYMLIIILIVVVFLLIFIL
jgi:hypothetical protein